MFSDRIRYMINVMIHLGINETGEFQTINEISQNIDIPDAYLNKIIGELSELGYLDTKKGPKGGVKLRFNPNEIFIKQFLNDVGALEHNYRGNECCVPSYAEECAIDHWIKNFKSDVIGKSTLSDLISKVKSPN